MNTSELIWGYLKGLLQKWYLVAIAILDFIGLLIFLFADLQIPVWLTISILGVVFVYANFLLYREGQRELLLLKEHYEAKLSDLKEKVRSMESRQPRLELFFWRDRQLRRSITIQVGQASEAPDLDTLVKIEEEELKQAFTQGISKRGQLGVPFDISRFAAFEGRKSREEYENDCCEYLERFRRYLVDSYRSRIFSTRHRKLNIASQNTGGVPGDDVIVLLDFPDRFHFLTDEEYKDIGFHEEYPEPPERPSITKSLLPNLSAFSSSLTHLPLGNMPMVSPQKSIRGPYIKKLRNSMEVRFEVDRLMHDLIESEFKPIEFLVSDEAVGHT